MNEVEFSELIDCNFPYSDQRKAEALIFQAKSISAAANGSVDRNRTDGRMVTLLVIR